MNAHGCVGRSGFYTIVTYNHVLTLVSPFEKVFMSACS